jgi:hypothetical protein
MPYIRGMTPLTHIQKYLTGLLKVIVWEMA